MALVPRNNSNLLKYEDLGAWCRLHGRFEMGCERGSGLRRKAAVIQRSRG